MPSIFDPWLCLGALVQVSLPLIQDRSHPQIACYCTSFILFQKIRQKVKAYNWRQRSVLF